MKVAILAGGKGTRFSEETVVRPKPMIEIGGRPILWHIMRHFAAQGLRDFTVALGYKGDVIRDWVADQETRHAGSHPRPEAWPDWSVTLAETGLETQTGGRIKALAPRMGNAPFLLTWGDGVSDIDVAALRRFHAAHNKIATMVVVRPPARFGHVNIVGDQITTFEEKPKRAEGWINGGIFVLDPEVFGFIADAQTEFERGPLNQLAAQGQLMAYRHEGYWQCMDTIHDRKTLETAWSTGAAPWATWRGLECVRS